MIYLHCKSFPVQRVTQKGAWLMDHIILGILFLVWGAADILRLELPGILGKRLKSASAEARRLQ